MSKDTVIANPTPKQEFHQSEANLKAHRRLIDSDDFNRSIKVAMAQYTRRICDLAPISLDSVNQLQASAMCFQRIHGMEEFVNTLMNLAERPALPQPRPNDNLTQTK